MTLYAVEPYEPRMSAQDVATLYAQRLAVAGPDIARMREVQALVDGDIVVPLPELNRNERSSIPNRAGEGLKQFSERIASSLPTLRCPPLRPGIDVSQKRAFDRRRAVLGWWDHTRLKTRLRQRARYMQGYGSSPVQIRWDADAGVPVWEERNPLATFPSLLRSPAHMTPENCIFETIQSLGWLRENYPLATMKLCKGDAPNGRDVPQDRLFTLLEYVDDTECVMVVLGARTQGETPPPGSMAVELERYPNRSGRCPVVVPRQIGLSKLHGQFDGMIGMHQTEALLTALSIIATRKGVIQDEWLVAHPNEEPMIVQVPDAAEGIPGIVKGGQLVPRGVDPQFQTNITIDRLAAAQQQTAGLSSELSGVAPTNVRTGARSSMLLSNVIDFPIQETQELFAESMMEENRIAIGYAKAYGGTKSFYVGFSGPTTETYQPADVFETDHTIVKYPMAGSDQAGLVIAGGQRLGMGTMSKREFMELDPLVEDAERSHDRIIAEALEDAMLESLKQGAVTGSIPPKFLGMIGVKVESNEMGLFAAVDYAHSEAQKLQATAAPATPPGAPGAPESQPGLTGPPQQPGAIDAAPNEAGLAAMLASLRRPQNVTPQEVAAGGPPR